MANMRHMCMYKAVLEISCQAHTPILLEGPGSYSYYSCQQTLCFMCATVSSSFLLLVPAPRQEFKEPPLWRLLLLEATLGCARYQSQTCTLLRKAALRHL